MKTGGLYRSYLICLFLNPGPHCMIMEIAIGMPGNKELTIKVALVYHSLGLKANIFMLCQGRQHWMQAKPLTMELADEAGEADSSQAGSPGAE